MPPVPLPAWALGAGTAPTDASALPVPAGPRPGPDPPAPAPPVTQGDPVAVPDDGPTWDQAEQPGPPCPTCSGLAYWLDLADPGRHCQRCEAGKLGRPSGCWTWRCDSAGERKGTCDEAKETSPRAVATPGTLPAEPRRIGKDQPRRCARAGATQARRRGHTGQVPVATRAAGDNEGDAVMGRGLSDLQKTILGLALENHDNHDGVDGAKGVDVIYSEILVKHFGWKGNTRDRYGKRIYSFTVFDRAAIGAKAYAMPRRQSAGPFFGFSSAVGRRYPRDSSLGRSKPDGRGIASCQNANG